MIKVNLLPQADAARKRRRKPGEGGPSPGAALVAIVLVLAYAAVIVVGFFVFYTKYQSDKELKAARQEQQVVKTEIQKLQKDYEDLKTIKALYENQLEVLNALDPPERLMWSEKMNLLPQLVPEGIYLTRIGVTEEVKEVETEDSLKKKREWEEGGRKGPKPPTVKKPVIRQTLTLEGVAYVEGTQTDKKRLQVFIDFVNSLKYREAVVPYTQKKKSFMEFFEDVVYEPFQADLLAGREVSRFVLKLRTRPLGGEK